MKLTAGKIVLYKLTQDDLDRMMDLAKDHGYHFNGQKVGHVVPVIVAKVSSDGTWFNGRAVLDGEADLWISSVTEGPIPVAGIEKEQPSGYQMTYSRLFGLPNYENEKIEISRRFPAEVDSVEALKLLKVEILGVRQRVANEERLQQRYQELQQAVAIGTIQSERAKKEISEIEKELQIQPDNDQVSLTAQGAAAVG